MESSASPTDDEILRAQDPTLTSAEIAWIKAHAYHPDVTAQMDATADAAVLAAYHARVTAAFGMATAAAIMQAARTDAERGR